MSPAGFDGPLGSAEYHPDLNDEVATLSTKLIDAINNQTNLDDTLSRTRMELDESRNRVGQLEAQNAEQREMLSGDVWVRRKTVEAEKTSLLSRVAEEKRRRLEVEAQKRKMEQELENLTAALFEEANKMVVTAKEEAKTEHEALHRRNDLLRAQLADTEGLLRSQQEQLAELKHVMEQMSDDQTALTAPSSPGFSKFDVKDDDRHASDGASQVGLEPISPSYPTSFTHLLQPVLRTDVMAYEDFIGLVKTSKRRSTHSRPPSGTQTSLAALGLALGGAGPATNGSTGSLTTAGTPVSAGFSPQTPNTPATAISASSGTALPPPVLAPLPPLKETKFYKRVLAEDIEPTLRLDTAPGLSWLARRNVLNAVSEGSLVVEPVPTTTTTATGVGTFFRAANKPLQYPCALCGDARAEEAHLRRHRFRTSEADSAQRYPLCQYCLGRVRSTCDFLGFLRMVKDGHWRADDEEAEKAAWEESVRLREQMFWSRIGGGVVPTPAQGGSGGNLSSVASVKSPRVPQDEKAFEVEERRRGAGGNSAETIVSHATAEERPVAEPATIDATDSGTATDALAAQASPPSHRDSTQSLAPSDRDGAKRLSLHIPGLP